MDLPDAAPLIVPVILAGGMGTRLWPLSRRRLPKQFLNLRGEGTMLQQTGQRAAALAGPHQVRVVTNQAQAELVRAQLPDLPAGNILVEPIGRGSAAAIGLAAVDIARDQPDALMLVLPSDHVIQYPDRWRALVLAASQAIVPEELFLFGLEPAFASSEYGYIKPGAVRDYVGDIPVYRAADFVEKPSAADAAVMVESGYFWNSGMFLWRARTILDAIGSCLPALRDVLKEWAIAPDPAVIELFKRLPTVSVDHGVIQSYPQRSAINATGIGRIDVGNLLALAQLWEHDKNGNAIRGRGLAFEAGSNIVSSDKPVVVAGVHDLVVLELDDLLLVCDRRTAHSNKRLLAALEASEMRELL